MSKKLEHLKDVYLQTRELLNEKELAALERRIWILLKSVEPRKFRNRCKWFSSTFGGPNYGYKFRSILYSYESWGDPLWERVLHRKMLVRTAVVLGRRAKRKSTLESISITRALEYVLEEYDGTGHVVVRDGHIYRSKHPNAVIRKNRDGECTSGYDVSSYKRFKDTVIMLTEEFLESRLGGIPTSIAEEMNEDFMYGLRVLFEDMIKKVSKLRADKKRLDEVLKISWHKYRSACGVLGIIVRKQKPLAYESLKKRYRTRAARFHPDRNSGDEKYVKQYHAVNEAWEIIKAYHQQELENGKE